MRKRVALGLALAIGAVVAYFFIRTPPSQGKSSTPRATPSSTVTNVRQALAARPAGAAKPKPAANAGDRTIFAANWGGGPDELGHDRPAEGNPVGPMSLGADSRGRLSVLDGVNGRIVRRTPDGKADSSFRIDSRDPQDIAVSSDGTTAVLDRFSDKAVSVYDDAGKLRGKLPLEGQGISDVGSVTGVFVDGTDIYAEKEHGPLVKIGTTNGAPVDPRSEIPGRPSRDGLSFLNAGITEAPAGRVWVSSIERATNQHRFTRELQLESYVRMIVLLDSDRAGTIYFAAEVEKTPSDAEILLSCLDPLTGAPVGGAILPANTLPEESMRDLIVLDGGGVIQALRTEKGVTYKRYDCDGN